MDIYSGWNASEATLTQRPQRHRKAKRKLVDGVFCPRCRSEAIYRYGKTVNGRKRYLCQVCRRQFSLKRPGRLEAEERPACPTCGKPMHVYMRKGCCIRFRCADYPNCRTFFKREMEAHRIYARLLPLCAQPDEGQEPGVETPTGPQKRS
jgi:ssDNA-binding Zn-finger/Zn-ribbon topoisomerase 1